ncbi:hypothetical protein [Hyphomicrobium sp. ghe19]|uniref:hypothetical protein n=1 Tax=Hyphomicrobium sp. ghe19 TaxID=2682968 RepID=UPI0013678978|nr:hypothetical protein HYPP_02503 [Hyphomicrobium sp. ghe19]
MAKLVKKGFIPKPVEEPVEETVVPVVEAVTAPPVEAAPQVEAVPAPNTHEVGSGGVYRSTGDGKRIRLR